MTHTKVLHLITELNVGGAERALARLLKGMDRALYEPLVACLYGSQGQVAASIRGLGIRVVDLGMSRKWRLDALVRLYWLLREERPGIVHTWLFHANVLGRLVGRLSGAPVVVSGERTMGMEPSWRYAVNRLTLPLVDRVVCVSSQVAEYSRQRIGVPREKIVVIPNGVDAPAPDVLQDRRAARSALGLPFEGVLVGTVARLEPVKRLDVLLRAMGVLERVPAVIVGYGSLERRLERIAEELGLGDRVRFAGYQPDVWPWLSAFDVFALSSDWEGMPNAVLEAMAVGLPVVATSAGGTPDVVVQGVTGLLVPPGDHRSFAGALERLVRDSGLRQTMGEAGRRRVMDEFSAARMVQRTQALYAELLG
jgi:glycosyltransferase involved in cell wall biosynthesis